MPLYWSPPPHRTVALAAPVNSAFAPPLLSNTAPAQHQPSSSTPALRSSLQAVLDLVEWWNACVFGRHAKDPPSAAGSAHNITVSGKGEMLVATDAVSSERAIHSLRVPWTRIRGIDKPPRYPTSDLLSPIAPVVPYPYSFQSSNHVPPNSI